MKYRILFIVALLSFLPLWGKADRVKRAYKNLTKNKLEQTKSLLDKALEKNPQSAGAKYVYALWFLHPFNTQRNLDSAYAYVLSARSLYPQTKNSYQKKWNKLGINDSTIVQKKGEIDSLAFAQASESHSINAYQYFIDHFPTGVQVPEAKEKRNALAYQQAQEENTYQSYKYFLDTYPDARQSREAKELYDILLFEHQTKGGSIADFENFTKLYPNSPFRKEAERTIFEMFTAPHTLQTYRDFIKRYSDNRYTDRAWQWIYFLYKQENSPENFLKAFPDFYDKNYVNKLMAAEKMVYYPVYEEDKYGFVDVNGVIQIPIRYDSLPNEYFCEGVKEDLMLVYQDNKTVALDKIGKQVIPSAYEQIEQMEEGLLKVLKDNKRGLYHQAGFQILPARYDEIETLDDLFLLVTQGDKKGLTTFNGKKITPFDYDDIKNVGEGFIVFEKDDKAALTTQKQLLENSPGDLPFLYNNISWIKKGFVKVEQDEKQGIVNSQLQAVIPPVPGQIEATVTGWTAKNAGQIQIYRMDGQLLSDSVFTEVTGNSNFYAVKKNDRWAILKTDGTWYTQSGFDAIPLLSEQLFVAQDKNKLYVSSGEGKLLPLIDFVKVSLQKLATNPQQVWLVAETKAGKKGLLTATSEKLLPAKYDDIQVWEPNLIYVKVKDKVGLLDAKGKELIPLTYDGLNYQGDYFVATLKKGKFGLVNIKKQTSIPNQYSSLLKKYDPSGNVFIARKEDNYGLVSHTNQTLADFEFDEIRYWQMGVALVKKEDIWYLYDIAEKRFLYKPIEYIKSIKEDEEEIILKVYQSKMYGILSNTRGQVIACEYDDLRNVGSEKYPLYLAEKHINDADVYLVYYIDREGKPVRKQIFDQQKYNQTVCE